MHTRDYGFYARKGLKIWTEPRGIWAGYDWPQYSVHCGQLQFLLYKTPLDRAGADCLVTDARAGNFDNDDDGACLYFQGRDGRGWREQDQLEIGPDGSHSALRQQMCPDEGAPIRGGEVMWRENPWRGPFSAVPRWS